MSPTYYFSGIDRPAALALLEKEQAAGMVNALNFPQPQLYQAIQYHDGVQLVLDSGAFQGNEDIDGYIELVKRHGRRFTWYANLDVIGSQADSDRNYNKMAAAGLAPVYVYQVEGGASLYDLWETGKALGFVAIGGVVPLLKSKPSYAMDVLKEIGNVLVDTNARAHVFGLATPAALNQLAHEPWFKSADSAAWLVGLIGREIIDAYGRRIQADKAGYAFTSAECAAQNMRIIHGWLHAESLQLSFI